MTQIPRQPNTILIAGAGSCAVAALRPLLATGAHLRVFGPNPAPQITAWAEAGALSHIPRVLTFSDVIGADRLIAATGNTAQDIAAKDIAARAGLDHPTTGHVHFVGAGPGDPDLLTFRAHTLLREAEVILHDRLVPDAILALANPAAKIIETGKTAFGPSWSQGDINALLVAHGANARVVRLKSGDSGIFGRLDEEMDALDAAGIAYTITPGITASVAAAATLKTSLTKRGRNTGLRIITGHDTEGYADHDWRTLAEPGAVAAIYMGKSAATYLRGRLLMHGAEDATPVTIVENASRPDQRILPTTLLSLPDALDAVTGPAVLMLGLAPREAAAFALKEAL
ncbi:MAG: uroporphyrinogen-III C-methyltransferase [Rhodobacteraceae bacterium]|nr:uroporphyrinogen-III C-methyltransferase [Paracoccaceae bacterium]